MESKKVITILAILVLVLAIGGIYQTSQVIINEMKYQEAIKQGTENTILALKMNGACMYKTNLTEDELVEAYFELFVKGTSKESNLETFQRQLFLDAEHSFLSSLEERN